MLRISKGKDGIWFVDMFNDTHNHKLSVTPTKVMKHLSYEKLHRSLTCKSLMVELGQSGLKLSQIKKVVNAMKTPQDLDITSKAVEEDEDFKTVNSKPILSSVHPIEAKAGISQLDIMPHISIQDHVALSNMKERPKNANMIKSSLELAKKKRTCSHCQGLGHYATGCPSKKVEETLQEKH
ncbi:unnamed protein product [Lactuca saligna]|uniref:Protein FAR1-RELATED SEQUENCE n=1 Tax=Lactuca saligna TaxID=75948 RepID=A0AA35YHF0_LACSI|nr:unnamed protein product [Lactuca saligna]